MRVFIGKKALSHRGIIRVWKQTKSGSCGEYLTDLKTILFTGAGPQAPDVAMMPMFQIL
jgi:hypothetical protein